MSGDSHELTQEPIRGIPAPLPPGESLLWQGAPRWRSIATHVFHVRAIAIYFAALLCWRLAVTLHDGGSLAAALVSSVPLVGLALVAIGVLSGIAWLMGRTTVYSITSQRVFLRIGVALPISLNIPFKIVGSASLKMFADGTGSIPLALAGRDRIAYLVLWPHARPWKFGRAEPTLRFLPDAKEAAHILSRAVAAAQAGAGPVVLSPVLTTAAPVNASPANDWPGAPAAA